MTCSAPYGRFGITEVSPVIHHGQYPAKAVVDEAFPVRATVFREGHDAVGATVVLTNADGEETRFDMTQILPIGLDRWEAWVRPDALGEWTFRVEAYSDDWHTWRHHADVKLPINQDVALVCMEAKALFNAAKVKAKAAKDSAATTLLQSAIDLFNPKRPVAELVEFADLAQLDRVMRAYGPRPLTAKTQEFPVRVVRQRALFGSWYEFFPRSQGAEIDKNSGKWISGTFDSSHDQLERVAEMGFDVVYLPPIHPIGETFRKGPNNTLTPGPNDPGSPWAIGGKAGGHDAIHPDLGDLKAFDRFVAKAKSLDLEIAMDFALQASPDHPWVTNHPEWFTTRLDGTIAYAENPPKKYQDIYPINFDNDPEGIYNECLRILLFWIDRGVTAFRVDNPHTKPINFWEWLLAEVYARHPEVIFFSEAFTRPPMLQGLGQIGFHQSYTYFTWRNTRKELESYLDEVSHDTAHQMRPNFFVNTPDINPKFIHSGAPAAFAIRLVLATMMSPSWGMYSGFELLEHAVLKPGGEEYLNSEKFEYRPRDYDAKPNLNVLIGRLNEIRREHPALQQLRQVTIHPSSNDEVIVFSKRDRDDLVIIACSLNPHAIVQAEINLDMAALGLSADAEFAVHDELSGADFTWHANPFVSLTPGDPAHILSVRAAS